jgi:hypothetical protein
MAHKSGFETRPKVVAELGPGDSLGTGLAALLSGVCQYRALDVVRYARDRRNVAVFDELVRLFQLRAPVPGPSEFSDVEPLLSSYEFPSAILHDELLQESLNRDRVRYLRAFLEGDLDAKIAPRDQPVSYMVPWTHGDVLEADSVDMVYSQAVLEHVDDLPGTYSSLIAWLKPGGFMSHQVDFRCHGTASSWNGHWARSEFAWKLLRGRQTYLINREPCSAHLRYLQESGALVVRVDRTRQRNGTARHQLAPQFRKMSDDDLRTRSAFIQAVKPPGPGG